jgi:hypothetical protein
MTTGGTQEKKGVMEKIKEKMPGCHKDYNQHHQQATAATCGGYGRTTNTHGTMTN